MFNLVSWGEGEATTEAEDDPVFLLEKAVVLLRTGDGILLFGGDGEGILTEQQEVASVGQEDEESGVVSEGKCSGSCCELSAGGKRENLDFLLHIMRNV
jgi:hypothetical protein